MLRIRLESARDSLDNERGWNRGFSSGRFCEDRIGTGWGGVV